MDITGNLFTKISITEGEGMRGTWKKGMFVIERDDERRTKVALVTFNNEVIEQMKRLQPGAWVKATFDVESREYNGRWYTDLRCFRVDLSSREAVPSATPQHQAQPKSQKAAQANPQPQRILPADPQGYDPFDPADGFPF